MPRRPTSPSVRPADRRPLALALALLLAVLFAVPSATAAEPAEEGRIQNAIALARDRVYPALVNIGVITQRISGGRILRFPSAGSGVIVSPAGHVLTNFHVVEDATRITCTLTNGEQIDADIVVNDPLTDLAVLRLRMDQRDDPTRPLFFAQIGDSDDIEVGDEVLAMGNPRSLSSSVTLGIVANTDRVFKSFTGATMEPMELSPGQLTGLFTKWIQHDALIQPGNSGGPLVNLNGEVIGINELGGTGMGFAIPSNLAKHVLNQALTFGEVRRGWLGVTVHPVQPLDRETGALVASVLPGGPMAEAGIEAGDILVAVGGRPADVRIFEDAPGFYAQLADLRIGSEQPVVYLRGDEQFTTTVKVARMEPFLGEERVFQTLGLSAQGITPPMAFARGYPDTRGVVVTSLRPGKPPEVARPALQRGDVILEIGGDAVEDVADLERLEEKHADEAHLLVRFRRDNEEMVTALDMTRTPPRRRGTELAKAWLGVSTQVMTRDVAEAMGLEGRMGFRITRVLPETEAAKAGLKVGDIILSLDGDELRAYRLQDAELLRRRIEDMDIGGDVTLGVLRDGEEISIDVTLEETPDTASDVDGAEDDVLEYSVRELTYLDKVKRDWPLDIEGLLVKDVENGGWANVSGLQAGDLLLALQDQPIKTIDQFEAATEALHEARPELVKLFVRRGNTTAFVFIEPEWPE